MRKFLWLVFISFLLGGCETVPTDTAANRQSSKHDRRPAQVIETDKAIEQTALEEFHEDADLLNQIHVHINAYNGLALLTGEVTSPELKNKILDRVRVIPHVKMVRDSLTLGALSSSANDAKFTAQIKAALKQIHTLPDFNASMIKVVTENNVVYLLGLVSKEEGNVVVNVVRLQPDVQQIVTVFEYIN